MDFSLYLAELKIKVQDYLRIIKLWKDQSDMEYQRPLVKIQKGEFWTLKHCVLSQSNLTLRNLQLHLRNKCL